MDDVFFDEFSFPFAGASAIIETSTAYAKNFTIGNVKNRPWIRSQNVENLELYGNLVLANKNVCEFSLHRLSLKGNLTTNTAFFAGQYINYIEVDGGGKWTLLDSLTCYDLALRNGTLFTNGQSANIHYFYGSGENTPKRLELANSHWYISGNF